MWYFTWVLGLGFAVLLAILNALLGMALGLSAKKVGVHENVSDSRDFLKAKGLG